MAVLSSEEVEDMRPGADEGQGAHPLISRDARKLCDSHEELRAQLDQARCELSDWHQELAERMGVSEGTDPDEVLSIAEGFKQRAERLGYKISALRSTLKHHADVLAACTKALGEAQRELAELAASPIEESSLARPDARSGTSLECVGVPAGTRARKSDSPTTAGENPAAKDTDEFGLEPLVIKTGQLLSASPIRTEPTPELIQRDESTSEKREFWTKSERDSKHVESWPDWKRAGINVEPTPEKAEKTRCTSCARHGYGHYTTGERAAGKACNGTGEESGS